MRKAFSFVRHKAVARTKTTTTEGAAVEVSSGGQQATQACIDREGRGKGIKKSIQAFLEGEGREKRVSISDTGAHRPGGRGKRGVEREGSTMKN